MIIASLFFALLSLSAPVNVLAENVTPVVTPAPDVTEAPAVTPGPDVTEAPAVTPAPEASPLLPGGASSGGSAPVSTGQ